MEATMMSKLFGRRGLCCRIVAFICATTMIHSLLLLVVMEMQYKNTQQLLQLELMSFNPCHKGKNPLGGTNPRCENIAPHTDILMRVKPLEETKDSNNQKDGKGSSFRKIMSEKDQSDILQKYRGSKLLKKIRVQDLPFVHIGGKPLSLKTLAPPVMKLRTNVIRGSDGVRPLQHPIIVTAKPAHIAPLRNSTLKPRRTSTTRKPLVKPTAGRPLPVPKLALKGKPGALTSNKESAHKPISLGKNGPQVKTAVSTKQYHKSPKPYNPSAKKTAAKTETKPQLSVRLKSTAAPLKRPVGRTTRKFEEFYIIHRSDSEWDPKDDMLEGGMFMPGGNQRPSTKVTAKKTTTTKPH